MFVSMPGIVYTNYRQSLVISPVVGCSDGKIVSWSLSTPPDAELVNTILDNVVERLNAVERAVIHRDRGGIIAGRKE